MVTFIPATCQALNVLFYLIPTIALGDSYYFHVTDQETEAERGGALAQGHKAGQGGPGFPHNFMS